MGNMPRKSSIDRRQCSLPTISRHQQRSEDRPYHIPQHIRRDEPSDYELYGSASASYDDVGSRAVDGDDAFYRASFEERNCSGMEDTANTYATNFGGEDDRDSPYDSGYSSRSEDVKNNNWKGGLHRRGPLQHRRVAAPTREPHIEQGTRFKRPTRILKDHEGQELANRTIRDYLVFRFEADGPLFSRWWYHLSTMQRTDMLNVITENTIPVIAAKLGQVSLLLESGGPRHGARVLTDFSLKTILCPCSCSDEECLLHDYRDQLLHDLHYYVMCWEVAEETDYQFCVRMVQQGIFPDRSRRDGSIKFMEPPREDDPLQVHQVLVLQENAPRQTMESVLAMVDAGCLKEHSPFTYLLLRDSYRLAIYALVMELFDELELGQKPEMPLARLQGCEYCRQTCISASAIQCPTCTAKWWCGAGCRHASAHGHSCPVGKPTKIRVQFS